MYARQNQIYEGVERDFDYDDGGEDYEQETESAETLIYIRCVHYL